MITLKDCSLVSDHDYTAVDTGKSIEDRKKAIKFVSSEKILEYLFLSTKEHEIRKSVLKRIIQLILLGEISNDFLMVSLLKSDVCGTFEYIMIQYVSTDEALEELKASRKNKNIRKFIDLRREDLNRLKEVYYAEDISNQEKFRNLKYFHLPSSLIEVALIDDTEPILDVIINLILGINGTLTKFSDEFGENYMKEVVYDLSKYSKKMELKVKAFEYAWKFYPERFGEYEILDERPEFKLRILPYIKNSYSHMYALALKDNNKLVRRKALRNIYIKRDILKISKSEESLTNRFVAIYMLWMKKLF